MADAEVKFLHGKWFVIREYGGAGDILTGPAYHYLHRDGWWYPVAGPEAEYASEREARDQLRKYPFDPDRVKGWND